MGKIRECYDGERKLSEVEVSAAGCHESDEDDVVWSGRREVYVGVASACVRHLDRWIRRCSERRFRKVVQAAGGGPCAREL